MHKAQRLISYLFCILFFVVPLIIWPTTSEVFEFNKIVTTYAFTTLIVGTWTVRMISEKKIIFRRTILDTPLILYLLALFLSTLFSIDPRTSILGYYSRFNGGLLSILCYTLLYWAYVSNMTHKSSKRVIYSVLLASVIVSIYGIAQHFGIDKGIWVQDVQNRIFSSLGQPNWLAAFLVALTPFTFIGLIKKPYSYILSALFFTALLFTKSRSGILGFGIANLVYWGYTIFKFKKEYLKEFLTLNLIFLVLFLFIKTPFTSPQVAVPNAPALETGGTESGSIRKIVWKGATNLWMKNPILGSGPETFGYAYYLVRPTEHNLVSEWDFIYNKAHNEFLNIAATTGTLGLISYLLLIYSSFVIFTKNLRVKENFSLRIALLSGYLGLIISNFFGFSVVISQLILFLFPAFAITLDE